jgi:hypothetical protein
MAVAAEIPAPRTLPAAPAAPAALPRGLASALLALGVAAAYLVGGEWAAARHVVAPDALAELGRATLAWHGDPSKLAYVGFAAPPLPRLSLIPVALFGHGLAALPVTGALLAGAAVALLDRTLARCSVPGAPRAALVAAVALDPLLVFHAGAGTPVTLELALLALGLHGLVGWAAEASPAALLEAGAGFGLLVLTRYELGVWWLVSGLAIAAALAALAAPRDEIEGSTLAFAAPGAAAAVVWLLLAALVTGSVGGWVTDAWSAGPPAGLGAGETARHLGELLLWGAPLALVAAPALVARRLARRDVPALGLAALLVAGALAAGLHAEAADRDAPLTLAHALPLLLAAVVGAGWLYRGARLRLVLALALALVVAGDVASWHAMTHYPIQDGERAWARAVRTGDDAGGARAERAIAGALPARGRVACDDETAAPIAALTGHPAALETPGGVGSARWRRDLHRVEFVLARRGDAVDRAIPGLLDSTAPGYVVVVVAPPYVLARVVGAR